MILAFKLYFFYGYISQEICSTHFEYKFKVMETVNTFERTCS